MPQQRSEETRERLLSAAERLFASQGYDATGVNHICAAARISKGAFYHHFPTKLALFQALLENWLGQLDAQLESALTAGMNPRSALLAMAAGMQPVFDAAGSRTRIILEFWIQSGRQPDLWQTAVAPYHRYLERFAALFATTDSSSQTTSPPDAQAQARILLALALGFLLQSFFDPTGAAWSELSVQSIQIMMDGLERKTS